MIQSKPIRAIKLNISKNLLTMLVNYSIFNLVMTFHENVTLYTMYFLFLQCYKYNCYQNTSAI